MNQDGIIRELIMSEWEARLPNYVITRSPTFLALKKAAA